MGKVTIGLKRIEVGLIKPDGSPATMFKKFGNVSTDSFAFAEGDFNIRNVNVEQFSLPLKIHKTKGQLVASANIADPDTDMYAFVRGGIIDTSTPGKKKYSEGDDFVNVECTVRVFPIEGLIFTINRASLSGLIVGGMGKNQELYLAINISALKPTKPGVKVIEVVSLDTSLQPPAGNGVPYSIPFLVSYPI